MLNFCKFSPTMPLHTDHAEFFVESKSLSTAGERERYADAIVYRDETETLPGWNDHRSQATHIDSRYG